MTNRNSNDHFNLAPQVEIERSTFDRSTNVKTSFSVGELVPFFCDEILPGDTYRIETSKVMRLQTLITPVMDNLYLDTYYFFVPNRLVWDNWEDFITGGIQAGWSPVVERTVPMTIPPLSSKEGDVNGWDVGTIADYMGIPPYQYDSTAQLGVNSLPLRCYAKIVDDWFRDENLQDPIYIYTGDSDTTGSNGDNYVTDIQAGGQPFIANKYHDFFTSCLLQPQKGPDVPFLDGYVPVIPQTIGSGNLQLHEYVPSGTVTGTRIRENVSPHNTVAGEAIGTHPSLSALAVGDFDGVSTLSNSRTTYFSNLFANLADAHLPGDYSTTSINTLRQAFQVQRMLEKDARGGTRYIELIKAHFSVTSPDARLQRAEYLGGNRVPFNIEQVLQTSSTDSTTPQGNVAGWSQTNDSSYDVEKSFVEHGWIIGLMCARYDHTYQQGLEKQFQRYGRYDYYWPTLAHLGERAVGISELYWNGMNQDTQSLDYHFQIEKEHVFGYQEAWAEYRYKPNYVTGQMRSAYAQSLDFWHFADYYESRPYLSADWIKEDKSNVDRTLAVQSETADQIFGDIFIEVKATRPMPLYSIPGLIDHF